MRSLTVLDIRYCRVCTDDMHANSNKGIFLCMQMWFKKDNSMFQVQCMCLHITQLSDDSKHVFL